MTKKDYELIASCLGAALANSYHKATTAAIYDVADRLKLELSLQNPRFNKQKFELRIEYWEYQHIKSTEKVEEGK